MKTNNKDEYYDCTPFYRVTYGLGEGLSCDPNTGEIKPIPKNEASFAEAMYKLKNVCAYYKKVVTIGNFVHRKSKNPRMPWMRDLSCYDDLKELEMMTTYPVVRHYLYEDIGDNFFAIGRQKGSGHLLGYTMNRDIGFIHRTIFQDSEEESAEHLVEDSPYIGKVIAEIVEDFITF